MEELPESITAFGKPASTIGLSFVPIASKLITVFCHLLVEESKILSPGFAVLIAATNSDWTSGLLFASLSSHYAVRVHWKKSVVQSLKEK